MAYAEYDKAEAELEQSYDAEMLLRFLEWTRAMGFNTIDGRIDPNGILILQPRGAEFDVTYWQAPLLGV
jgi:hypothetical protein